MHPWEIHPALVHFPIAFLIGGVALDLFAALGRRPDLARVATKAIAAGAVTGLAAGAAGGLAFFTIPGIHAEWAHRAILWHLSLASTGLVLVAVAAWSRRGEATPSPRVRALGAIGIALVCVASYLGGTAVYHAGMGVDPDVVILPSPRS